MSLVSGQASCCVGRMVTIAMLAWCLQLPVAFAYDIGNRWTTTQTDGSGIARGDAITLSWSIVPDGEGYSRSSNSEVIDYLDDGWNVEVADRSPDLTNRAWWGWMDRVYDQYSRVSGISMVYVHEQFENGNDTGQFGDIRIGGAVIPEDPGQNILADNAFPNNGDMRIDTRRVNGNVDFFHSNGPQLRNLIAHESGHGVGLNHSDIISGANAVMETPLESNFWGLQFDDIYAINRQYGDPLEKNGGNDSFGTAYQLGSLGLGDSVVLGSDASDTVVDENDGNWVGIDGSSDQDWYRFSVTEPGAVSIDLRPQGPSYVTAEQGSFNAKLQNDLSFQFYDSVGNLLSNVDEAAIGSDERLRPFGVSAPGDYLVRVNGSNDSNQFYELDVLVNRPARLAVDRNTGAMSVTTPFGDVEIDAYTITSASGSLDSSNWQSLQDQATPGWSEVNSSNGLIGELQAVGTTQLTSSSSLSLGDGFAPELAGIAFGTDPADLVFQYRNAATGESEQGFVEYSGQGFLNNLLLAIDPETGDARIINESATTIEVDAYTIASDSGALLTDWDSLADQQSAGWQEALPSSTRISELNPSETLTLAPDSFLSLDGLWDTLGLQDISDLDFEFRDAAMGTFEGIIQFVSFVPTYEADFDGDGDVDSDDLTKWRADYAVNGNSDANGDGQSNGIDFMIWQQQLGSGLNTLLAPATAVPEPTSALLFLTAVITLPVLKQCLRDASLRGA